MEAQIDRLVRRIATETVYSWSDAFEIRKELELMSSLTLSKFEQECLDRHPGCPIHVWIQLALYSRTLLMRRGHFEPVRAA